MRARLARRLAALATASVATTFVAEAVRSDVATGTIRGRVVIAGDSLPVPNANVIVLGKRIGALVDERGAFRLTGVPAGRAVIQVRLLGERPVLDTLDVPPGGVVERLIAMPFARDDRIARARDSLVARGLWPPRLDATLEARMRNAREVRVFRLSSEAVYPPPDTVHYIAAWRIVGEVHRPSHAEIDALLATFGKSELYLQDLMGEIKACGGFQPGIAVRYLGDGPATDLLLCYKCGEFSIASRDGIRQSGDFVGEGAAFAHFAQAMFPRDPEIRKLGAPHDDAATDRR